MAAGIYHFVGSSACEQGAAFQHTLTYQDSAGQPVNLTGYTARMQVKERGSDAAAILLTTEGGGITFPGTGQITLTIGATATAALPALYMEYDLFVTAPGDDPTRLLAGIFQVLPRITMQ